MKKLFLSLSVCAMSLSAIAAPNSALLIYQDAEKSTGTMLTDPYSGTVIDAPDALVWPQGFGMYLLKSGKTYSPGITTQGYGSPVKLSNGAPNLITLPDGCEVEAIEFVGYCNVVESTSWISSVATEVNGTFTEVYTDVEGTNTFPYYDRESWAELMPGEMPKTRITFETPVTGKLWFKNGGSQPAFYVRVIGSGFESNEPSDPTPPVPPTPPSITEPTNTHVISYVPDEGMQVKAKDITLTYSATAGWHYYRDNQPFEYAGQYWDQYAAGTVNPKLGDNGSMIPVEGTYYKFTPARDGAIYLPAVLWEGKPLFLITGDNDNLVPDRVYVTDVDNYPRTWLPYSQTDADTGELVEGWSVSYENHMNPDIIRFAVSAGKDYYVYARSSKLRLCGFIFTPDEGLVLPEEPTPDAPVSIELMLSMQQGTTLNFGATVNPETAEVIWKSTDESVLKVDDKGAVTAVAEGEATLMAMTVNDLCSVLRIKVIPATAPGVILVETVNVTPDVVSAKEGTTVQLTANVTPDDATDKSVVWTSDNEAVATVDHAGLLSVRAEGKATVRATAADGSGVTGLCTVTGLKDESAISEVTADMAGRDVYTTDGRLVTLAATHDEILALPKGIYVIGALKVIIR